MEVWEDPKLGRGASQYRKYLAPAGRGKGTPQLRSVYWVRYLSLHRSTEKTNILTYNTVTVINRYTPLNPKKICGHSYLNGISTWQVWYTMQQRLLPGGSLIFNCFCAMRRHSIYVSSTIIHATQKQVKHKEVRRYASLNYVYVKMAKSLKSINYSLMFIVNKLLSIPISSRSTQSPRVSTNLCGW
jgi:hypothetical protein